MNRDARNALQPVAPTEANSTAYICRLPNEVLRMIFNFLFDLGKRSPFPNDADQRYVSPVVTVRWVCSWFRKIASHHPIWLDDRYSDLSSFLPSVSGKFIKNRGQFLETLLDDDDLCNCLRRREAWEFTASADFLAVTKRKPSLVNNTRTVRLLDIDADLPAVINEIGVFTSLTTLTIGVNYNLRLVSCFVDLSAIARSCQLLRKLELYGEIRFCGSLSTLRNVEELTIDNLPPCLDRSCPFISFLPVESSHCLSRLHFQIRMDINEYEHPASNPFDSFPNLTSLYIDISNPEVLDFIADARFSLIELTIVGMILDNDPNIGNHGPLALSRLLSATSLKSLKRFIFEDLAHEDYRFEDSHISAMAALEDLEHVYLEVRIPVASWFVLASPRKLKYLCASVDWEEFDENKDIDEFTSAIRERGGFARVDTVDDYAVYAFSAER
jgi:hypothetical protein